MNDDLRPFRLLKSTDLSPDFPRANMLAQALRETANAVAQLNSLSLLDRSLELRRLRGELALVADDLQAGIERRSYFLHQLAYCHDPSSLASLLEEFNRGQVTSSADHVDLIILVTDSQGVRWHRNPISQFQRLAFVNFASEKAVSAAIFLAPRAETLTLLHHAPLTASFRLQKSVEALLIRLNRMPATNGLIQVVKDHWSQDCDLLAFLDVPAVRARLNVTSDMNAATTAHLVFRSSGPLDALWPLVRLCDGARYIDLESNSHQSIESIQHDQSPNIADSAHHQVEPLC